MSIDIKKYWKHGIAIIVFYLISIINFYPVFEGKQLNFAERSQGMSKEMLDFEKETGEVTRWTNAMFSGMPTYYILGKTPNDLVQLSRKVFSGFMPKEAGYFFLGMLFFYILLCSLGVSPWLSIFGALSFAFTTNNLILLDTGHFTKLRTILSAPLLIAGVLMAYKKKNLFGVLLFALGFAINIKTDHPQMTYYLGLSMLPLILIYAYDYYKQKALTEFVKISGGLLLGLILAIGCSASKILPVMEYQEDTMRGKPVLTKQVANTSSSSVEGLDWDYAMNWSNAWIDLMQGVIPMAVGGSSTEKLPSTSNFAKEIRKKGGNVRGGVDAPLYWGGLSSTSGPIYFGAIVFLLFFISLFVVNDRLKWWLLIAVVLTSLLSLGRNLEFFNRFFFDYVPLFNKFRTPNSVLSVTAIFMPLLAFYGLHKIVETRPHINKVLLPGIGLSVFCFLYGILAPSLCEMEGAYDVRYAQMGLDISSLIEDRISVTRSSAFRSGIFMLLACGTLWLLLKNKIKAVHAFVIIGLLSFSDLIFTNFNYVSPGDYITDKAMKRTYQPRPVDTQILKDNDPNYRVLDLSIPTFSDAFASYFHKTIGGYHPAKLVRYQDLIEYHISRNNMDVLNMLNTKYIITQDENNGTSVQRNTAALGNAWFINNIKIVNSNEDEIGSLEGFDPLGTAIIHNEFNEYVSGSTNFQKSGSIQLSSYKPNRLVYRSESNNDQFAVFSEIWYGPNKGWQAYIDGKAVDHIRANYVLRAMKIPAGTHEIIFEFQPQSQKLGTLLSMICSVILFLMILVYGVNYFRPVDKKWFSI